MNDVIVSGQSAASAGGFSLELRERIVQGALRDLHRRRINEVIVAYRLAGTTVFALDDTRVGIRFDTFYGGEYFECYYAILELDQSDEDTGREGDAERIRLFRHTMPYFINVTDLARAHLNSDIKVTSTAADRTEA